MRLTFESIMAMKPCWEEEDVEAYFAGREYIDLETTLRDDSLLHSDRIWLAVELMDDRARRLFACDCAERAIKYVPEGEERPRQAVEVARRYANGEATSDELKAAMAVAWAAVRYSSRGAARAAAWAAAVAAVAAAWGGWASAWYAECEWQIERAIEYLEGVV
jgi:hypothetical protein